MGRPTEARASSLSEENPAEQGLKPPQLLAGAIQQKPLSEENPAEQGLKLGIAATAAAVATAFQRRIQQNKD